VPSADRDLFLLLSQLVTRMHDTVLRGTSWQNNNSVVLNQIIHQVNAVCETVLPDVRLEAPTAACLAQVLRAPHGYSTDQQRIAAVMCATAGDVVLVAASGADLAALGAVLAVMLPEPATCAHAARLLHALCANSAVAPDALLSPLVAAACTAPHTTAVTVAEGLVAGLDAALRSERCVAELVLDNIPLDALRELRTYLTLPAAEYVD
jgi:hypothetical protein